MQYLMVKYVIQLFGNLIEAVMYQSTSTGKLKKINLNLNAFYITDRM